MTIPKPYREALAPFVAALLMLLCTVAAQASYPIVRNFSKSEYGGGSQNWAIAQAPSGVMLVGNQYGMLDFDSRRWRLSGINYGTAVRSLMVDSAARRVYAGGTDEFGYFTNDIVGTSLHYHSLRHLLDGDKLHEIWNIFRLSDRVWLVEDFNVLSYDGRSVERRRSFSRKITASVPYGGNIALGFDDGDLCFCPPRADSLRHIATSLHSRVCALVPIAADSLVVVTAEDGLFLFSDGALSPFRPDLTPFLRDNRAFCAAASGSRIVVGTVRAGAVVCDLNGGPDIYIDSSCGLQNNTVLSAGFDIEGNLWLGLDNGIACAFINSPVRNLFANAIDYGAGYASLRRGAELLLGTNQGLFSMRYPLVAQPHDPHIRQLLSGQIWDLEQCGASTFVCADNGLFAGDDAGNFLKVDGIRSPLSVIGFPGNDDRILVSTSYGFYTAVRRGDLWVSDGPVEGLEDISGKPLEDPRGFLWLSQWNEGVWRLDPDEADRGFCRKRRYDSSAGLPPDGEANAVLLDGKVRFSTSEGIFGYNQTADRMEPDTLLAQIFSGLPLSRIYNAPDGALWVVDRNLTQVVRGGMFAAPEVDSVTFRSVSSRLNSGYENFTFPSDSDLIVGVERGFLYIDTRQRLQMPSANPVFISAIYSDGGDSLLYSAELFTAAHPEITLPQGLRSFRVEYVMPDYESAASVLYAVTLAPIGDDPGPLRWSEQIFYEFTEVPKGSYILTVHALDRLTGQRAQCSMNVDIPSPWYSSWGAWLVYCVLIILTAKELMRFEMRRSRKAAREIEVAKNLQLAEVEKKSREDNIRKDYEIARLKSERLEQEIRSKSNELSNFTLNLVRKNEILQDIGERLSRLEATIGSDEDSAKARAQIMKIRRLIHDNISHDDDWKTFTGHFDLVYNNFLERLRQQYPKLTILDQRLCAYIRMGLTSKDIAPLLNITYRSVEMSRYRIRRKMELDPDVSLADFLAKF